MNLLRHMFDRVESVFFGAAKVALLIMMVLTTVDVLSLYLFRTPLTGVYEFTEKYLMVAVVFLSIGYVMKIDGHIRLDIVMERFKDQTKRVLHICHYTLGLLLMVFVGYQGWVLTVNALLNSEIGAGIIQWQMWLSYVWIPIGSLLFVIRLALLIVDNVQQMRFSKSMLKSEGESL